MLMQVECLTNVLLDVYNDRTRIDLELRALDGFSLEFVFSLSENLILGRKFEKN